MIRAITKENYENIINKIKETLIRNEIEDNTVIEFPDVASDIVLRDEQFDEFFNKYAPYCTFEGDQFEDINNYNIGSTIDLNGQFPTIIKKISINNDYYLIVE